MISFVLSTIPLLKEIWTCVPRNFNYYGNLEPQHPWEYFVGQVLCYTCGLPYFVKHI